MKSDDLMIGDWVKKIHRCDYYVNAKIVGIFKHTCDCKTNDGEIHTISYLGIEHIPLTSEILEKNGFDCSDGEVVRYNFTVGDYNGHFSLRAMYDKEDNQKGWSFYAFNVLTIIDYVHELQHALKLCGINKTIEL